MTIAIPTDGAVWIGRNLYCKSPEALAIALETLRGIGYQLRDERVDGYSVKEGRTTPEDMEQHGWGLWYAKLDVRRVKCDKCNFYIDPMGTRVHGHTCEFCGAVTYREVIDGSSVRFEFVSDEYRMFAPTLSMNAKRWDTDTNLLYLYLDFHKNGWGTLTGDKAWNLLIKNEDKWDLAIEDGEVLLVVRYTRGFYVDPEAVISVHDIWGHEFGSKELKVWKGKEYTEWEPLPVPESFSIYETWHWAPLGPSPTLHQRVLSAVGNHDDKAWHYQDGRPWFRRETFEEMGKFVRHFTTLDAGDWDTQSRRFRLDGPGGIDDVAGFCHPDAEVQNKPNIGNFLSALTGLDKSKANTRLAAAAVQDDEVTQGYLGSFRRR